MLIHPITRQTHRDMLSSLIYRGESLTPIPHICHKHHKRCLWRKICHVENFSQMTDFHVEKFLHMTNCQSEKCLHMVNEEKNHVMWIMLGKVCHMETFINVEANPFCHYLCYFVAKSACCQNSQYLFPKPKIHPNAAKCFL